MGRPSREPEIEVPEDLTTLAPSEGWGGRYDPETIVLGQDAGKFTRKQAEAMLERCREAIHGENGLTNRAPRRPDEPDQDYVDRLVAETRDGGDLFWKAAAARAHIARLDSETNAQAQERAERDQEKHRRTLAHVRAEAPRLQEMISNAEAAEQRLSALYEDLAAAGRARKARSNLQGLNGQGAQAAEALGEQFAPFKAAEPHPEAMELLKLIGSASFLQNPGRSLSTG